MSVKTIKYILLFFLWLFFIWPLYSVISWYSDALWAFWSERWLQKSYPVVVFVTHTLTLIMMIILLFTPWKKNLSPLNYFTEEVALKIYLYFNYSDESIDKKWFSEKNSILASGIIDFIFMIVITVVYYYILKKVNQPQISYLYMIVYLIFIYIIISLNSFFTNLIWRAEKLFHTWWESDWALNYIQKKNVYAIVLIFLSIIILLWWEVISKEISWKIWSKDIPIVKWFSTQIPTSQNTPWN